MLQQRTTCAVHDALWSPSCARGIHDVKRVIKRELLKLHRGGPVVQKILKQDAIANTFQVWLLTQHWDDHCQLNTINTLHDGRGALQRITGFAIIVIAVGYKKYLWLNLANTIHGAIDAKIRRTGRPHRSNTGCCQHRDNRLFDIGYKGGDSITWNNALRT